MVIACILADKSSEFDLKQHKWFLFQKRCPAVGQGFGDIQRAITPRSVNSAIYIDVSSFWFNILFCSNGKSMGIFIYLFGVLIAVQEV